MNSLLSATVLIVAACASRAELTSETTGTVSAVSLEATPDGEPTLAITPDGTQVRITFSDTLEAAESATGPWMEVVNAVSPLSEDPAMARRFYRARRTGTSGIFSLRSIVQLTLTGPFQIHFEQAFAGMPDGIFPPHREKSYFDGLLEMPGLAIPVSMRVRGNSSLQECPFPKLKFKVSKDHRNGTPFSDAREIRIGTHCAEGGRGPIGRLRDETATFREALAYETMDLLGFVTPRVRRARIDYRDSTPAGDTSGEGRWQVIRSALILDDVEVVADRLGGHALDDAELDDLKDADFDEQLITDLRFLHALLGNWDYELTPDGRGLWNTEVIRLSNGKYVPVAGDFDLASWVTESVRISAPHDYHPELGEVERQARYQLEQIQGQVSAPIFEAAADRFQLHRTAIEGLINTAEIDGAGRTNALRHDTAFFETLAVMARKWAR